MRSQSTIEHAPPDPGILWYAAGFPNRGWVCVGIRDLNPDNRRADDVDYAACEACGHCPVRFVHTMSHPEWPDSVDVGCVCAEKLSDDYVNPKRHECQLRNRAFGRSRWLKRKWRTSANGNRWLKINDRHIVVFEAKESGVYGAAVDGEFSRRRYVSEQAAMLACYERFLVLQSGSK